MENLNIQFLEKYKQCDRFIRDAYQSSSGVTEYLAQMDIQAYEGQLRIQHWDEDYQNLKHCRWSRNQLAHEISIDTDFCTEQDYQMISDFYDRLMKADDPLARLYRCQRSGQTTGSRHETPKQVVNTKQTFYVSSSNSEVPHRTESYRGNHGFGFLLAVILSILAASFILYLVLSL